MGRQIRVVASGVLFLCGSVSICGAKGSPPYFSKYEGHYPREVLLKEPDLVGRMKTVLGSNYGLFKERMDTQTPFVAVGAAIVATACMAHYCDSEDAALIINLPDGKVTCVIHSTKWGGKSRYWDEDDNNVPKDAIQFALDQWN